MKSPRKIKAVAKVHTAVAHGTLTADFKLPCDLPPLQVSKGSRSVSPHWYDPEKEAGNPRQAKPTLQHFPTPASAAEGSGHTSAP